jgi:DNA-directed RNA polymerase subunit D
MEIKLMEKKPEKVVFLVRGINETLANTIRRTIQEVPTLAIDEVEFIKNDSALYDEILAHRLGLVPLKTEKDKKLIQECSCKGKGCSRCIVNFKLYAKGPCKVYTSDLKSSLLVVYKNIPLVDLSDNQELEFNAYARLGIAKEHTKFSPGLIYYKPFPLIKKADKSEEIYQKSVKINTENPLKTPIVFDLYNEVVEIDTGNGKELVKIEPSKEDFIFTLELWGQLSYRDILSGICAALNKNLTDIENKIKKLD